MKKNLLFIFIIAILVSCGSSGGGNNNGGGSSIPNPTPVKPPIFMIQMIPIFQKKVKKKELMEQE